MKTLSQKHRRRLTRLADYLDTLKRSQFRMSELILTNTTNPRFAFHRLKNHRCGTVACAMGYCPVVFPSLVKIVSSNDAYLNLTVLFNDTKYGGKLGEFIEGAAAFFGIYTKDAYQLFMPSGYVTENPTPKQVAKKIRDIMNGYRKEL